MNAQSRYSMYFICSSWALGPQEEGEQLIKIYPEGTLLNMSF